VLLSDDAVYFTTRAPEIIDEWIDIFSTKSKREQAALAAEIVADRQRQEMHIMFFENIHSPVN
jgi:hypothetical protein